MNPADFTEGKQAMIPRPAITLAELNGAKRRSSSSAAAAARMKRRGRSRRTTTRLPSKTPHVPDAGGGGLAADMKRLSAGMDTAARMEVWSIQNNSGGWSHPVHVHFEEGRILSRDGRAPPIWERWARKDVYRVGPGVDSSTTVEVAMRFREFLGTFMEHCHNTQHEDHSMLLRWDIIHPGSDDRRSDA